MSDFLVSKGIIYYTTAPQYKYQELLQDYKGNYDFYSCSLNGGNKKKSSYKMFCPYVMDGKNLIYLNEKGNLIKSKANDNKEVILVPYKKLQNIK